jgi:hypothetical protein
MKSSGDKRKKNDDGWQREPARYIYLLHDSQFNVEL